MKNAEWRIKNVNGEKVNVCDQDVSVLVQPYEHFLSDGVWECKNDDDRRGVWEWRDVLVQIGVWILWKVNPEMN